MAAIAAGRDEGRSHSCWREERPLIPARSGTVGMVCCREETGVGEGKDVCNKEEEEIDADGPGFRLTSATHKRRTAAEWTGLGARDQV